MDWTNGCIAVTDAEIEEIIQQFQKGHQSRFDDKPIVYSNDTKLCLAGTGDDGVLSAIVAWAAKNGTGDLCNIASADRPALLPVPAHAPEGRGA